MSKGSNSPGMSRLAGTLSMLFDKKTDTSLIIDFGEVQQDGSLITNTFPVPIPKTDYVICRSVNIEAGDHVLVAWVQNDAVVIDVITDADSVI